MAWGRLRAGWKSGDAAAAEDQQLRVLRATRQLETPMATAAFAKGLATILRGGDVVSLRGDLGAGKTTLVRALARALGAEESMASSPTFVMVNEYPLRGRAGAATRLVHVDAYRLGGEEDLDALGWDTFMGADGRAAGDAIVVIEWPERIESALPEGGGMATISLSPTAEESREAEIEAPDSWSARPGLSHLLERDPTRCRITGRWVAPTAATYPFHDERARLADLNRWFTSSYVASREIKPEDVDEA